MFCIEKWGTKWDVECGTELIDKELQLSFLSAWSPPIGVYNQLVKEGYQVKAYYFEPGLEFAGIFDNGNETQLTNTVSLFEDQFFNKNKEVIFEIMKYIPSMKDSYYFEENDGEESSFS